MVAGHVQVDVFTLVVVTPEAVVQGVPKASVVCTVKVGPGKLGHVRLNCPFCRRMVSGRGQALAGAVATTVPFRLVTLVKPSLTVVLLKLTGTNNASCPPLFVR